MPEKSKFWAFVAIMMFGCIIATGVYTETWDTTQNGVLPSLGPVDVVGGSRFGEMFVCGDINMTTGQIDANTANIVGAATVGDDLNIITPAASGAGSIFLGTDTIANGANPRVALTAYDADNIWMMWDCYWNSGTYSSDAGSNFVMQKNADALNFRYATGVDPGNTITPTTALSINLTDGGVSVPLGDLGLVQRLLPG